MRATFSEEVSVKAKNLGIGILGWVLRSFNNPDEHVAKVIDVYVVPLSLSSPDNRCEPFLQCAAHHVRYLHTAGADGA